MLSHTFSLPFLHLCLVPGLWALFPGFFQRMLSVLQLLLLLLGRAQMKTIGKKGKMRWAKDAGQKIIQFCHIPFLASWHPIENWKRGGGKKILVDAKSRYNVATYISFTYISKKVSQKSSYTVTTYLFRALLASGNWHWCWVPSPLASSGAGMKIGKMGNEV